MTSQDNRVKSGEQMIDRMNQIVHDLGPTIKSLDWSNPRVYAMWMSQAYYIARNSTSFLGLTMLHASKYPDLLARNTKHIAEESGHELMLLQDIENLGFDLSPELPMTSAVYQTQYYRIVAESPHSFLGYVFFLELLAPAYGKWIMNQVKGKNASVFVDVHTTADDDHIEEATKVFTSMAPEFQKMAMSNFEMTAICYEQMLKQIREASAVTSKAA